jgi:YebC/PmpR family DNA-binding regulatory protein
MSGHSKWANIKHKKEKADAKKGKIFTKIGREITVIVKQGGPDPESNTKLRDVILKAKAANMPNDTIFRNIKKASGDADSSNYEEIVYEGYGPDGVAVIVECLTDNRNRTAGDLRHYFDKYGGNLGQTGCVSFLFEKKGVIYVEKSSQIDEDEFGLKALEAGAEDLIVEDEFFEVRTEPEMFSDVVSVLTNKYELMEANIKMVPVTFAKLTDDAKMEKFEKLIDCLEDLDDVQDIYHNLEE